MLFQRKLAISFSITNNLQLLMGGYKIVLCYLHNTFQEIMVFFLSVPAIGCIMYFAWLPVDVVVNICSHTHSMSWTQGAKEPVISDPWTNGCHELYLTTFTLTLFRISIKSFRKSVNRKLHYITWKKLNSYIHGKWPSYNFSPHIHKISLIQGH